MVKNSPATAGDERDADLISGSGRSPRGGKGSPLQYSCLGNPMDRGSWQATVHGVTQGWKQLSTHTHITKRGTEICLRIIKNYHLLLVNVCSWKTL